MIAQSKLNQYLTDPGSFQASPGFQFALNQGLQATQRQNSSQRGSGNALAALANYGTGLASQEYGATIDRLGRLAGQDQQFQLGQEQNRTAATRAANDFTLGTQQNQNTAQRNAFDYSLGSEQNRNTATRNLFDYSLGRESNFNTRLNNQNQYGLGMFRAQNDLALGRQQNDITGQRDYWNYDLGLRRNALDSSNALNDFNLNNRRIDLDWYNANTNRGRSQYDAYYNNLRAFNDAMGTSNQYDIGRRGADNQSQANANSAAASMRADATARRQQDITAQLERERMNRMYGGGS
jgi:hypothetical protein